ncbi:MAG TPA: hypothetical protein VG722_06745, partial [Tepidisphaeraceae bacterium]|nr:hypothetical protein [Tepidisphaeraceae bacterium]
PQYSVLLSMPLSLWHWLVHTNAGLWTRIALGCAIFLTLALLDLRQNGKHATRWHEYGFLLACTLAAIAYGIINDQITSRISWEYFYFGKGLDSVLGSQLPPNPAQLHYQAMFVGIKATWGVGLIIGAAILLANNPRKAQPQLPYRHLFLALTLIFIIAAGCGTILGIASYFGLPTHFSNDFSQMVAHNEFRPYRFMTVFGIHLGGYIGGLIGCAAAILYIHYQRIKVGKSLIPTSESHGFQDRC